MKNNRLKCLFAICLFTSTAFAENKSYQWQGFYSGVIGGGAFADFNAKTSAQPRLLNPAQANTVNQHGNQTFQQSGFLTGIEGGYNWQFNRFVFGLETDIQALSLNDSINSGAIPYPDDPSAQFVISAYASNNWLYSLRPRFGFVANNWLFYATGGLGLAYLQSDFLFTNNLGALESKRINEVKTGYIIGAGFETTVTRKISFKAEYLFANFGNTTASNMHPRIATQTFSNSLNYKANIFRLGLNYHFDDRNADSSALFLSDLIDVNQWEFAIGTRAFLSSGIAGVPQPLFNSSMSGNILASRLIYSGLNAISQEGFARIDHESGLFLKGNLGAGSIWNGKLNDEDFPALTSYSNTYSRAWGNLAYGNLDLGFSFLKNQFGNTGAFIGYNYYAQNIGVYSCEQLAGDVVCVPSHELNNFLGISEVDNFKSMRVGLSSLVKLSNQLNVTTDVAYLPVVKFKGQDDHNARQLILPEKSNDGDGAMIEAALNYNLNENWRLGVGARYWMWNMHSGSVIFDFLGVEDFGTEPARYNAERYGVFMQLDYHSKDKLNDTDFSYIPNWRGIFFGGQLGAGWHYSDWSDPFGTSPSGLGGMNIAGFGDEIKATGPLGGAHLNLNWQTGQLVYGVGGTINIADVRGDDTLFSGIGGINGQDVVNYFGTIVGRLGTTYNRALFYIEGGGAFLNDKISLNGNTSILTLGSQSNTMTHWGWTLGAGFDYALTEHWTTGFEYNYIEIPSHVVSFSSMTLIQDQRISVRQRMNAAAATLSYKFDV